MFSSVVIPGILPAQPVRAANGRAVSGANSQEQPNGGAGTYPDSEHASMTAKNSPNSEGAEFPASSADAAETAGAQEIAADCPAEEHSYTVVQLYEQFRRPIHSYIYRLLGNQEDADDVTQEVFVRAFSAWDHLYERDNLSAWLYRIATNLCVDLLRRRKRISWWPLMRRTRRKDEAFESAADDEATFLPPDSGGIPEVAEREHIQLALARMPEEYAVVLVLNAAQGVPYQEIAAIVGISPNAAATRISRAKKMFIEHYQRIESQFRASNGVEETEDE